MIHAVLTRDISRAQSRQVLTVTRVATSATVLSCGDGEVLSRGDQLDEKRVQCDTVCALNAQIANNRRHQT